MKQATKTASFNAKKLQRHIKTIDVGIFQIEDDLIYAKQLDKKIKVIK